ncbi:MAG: glycosyltransferase [Candidatus Contendobacter sp.]|nr:glycosyltransferase [Candidatus Contendobacter sp.]MDG4559369.1 glycosyltransferase [Candidatus Contendobacter sp.]
MPLATVLIPTHDHADTIRYALASVQTQTVQDFEVLVVGDGAPQGTSEIMAEVCAKDSRFHYFPNAKGAGHGEYHRAAALAKAKGDVVAYLGDDDLWLPHHLESLLRILQDADFAHTLHTAIQADGEVVALGGDLACETIRQSMRLAKWNFFGLTCVGHTLAAYRRLPYGWRPRPEGLWSDLHMWRQWLDQPWCRFHSEPIPTTLHFPSPWRNGWTVEQRLRELGQWSSRLTEAGFDQWLLSAVLKRWQRQVVEPEVLHALGNLLSHHGCAVESESLQRKAIEINPKIPGFYVGLSVSLYQRQKFHEAVIAAQQATEMEPGNPHLLSHLGSLLGLIGQFAEGEMVLRKAIALDSKTGLFQRHLSQILYCQRRFKEAIQTAREAVRLDPDNPEFKNHLNNLL